MLVSCQDANLNSCNAGRRGSSIIGSQGVLELTQSKMLDNGGSVLGTGFGSGGMLSYEKWSSAGDGGSSVSGKSFFFMNQLLQLVVLCFNFRFTCVLFLL